jgi:hypothetical protein
MTFENIASSGLSMLLGGFTGSFLGSYLKKKGENLATHEDLRKLVQQVEATTIATKSIEAKITNEVWDRQRQWEMKRDAVFDFVSAIVAADDALNTFASAIELERGDSNPERWVEQRAITSTAMNEALDRFDYKRTIALLVCNKSTHAALLKMSQILRGAVERIRNETAVSYTDVSREIRPALARVLMCARKEVGYVGDEE